jgi:hypothetical protein
MAFLQRESRTSYWPDTAGDPSSVVTHSSAGNARVHVSPGVHRARLRAGDRTVPCPWHVGQVSGLVPGLAPEPLQISQFTQLGTRIWVS